MAQSKRTIHISEWRELVVSIHDELDDDSREKILWRYRSKEMDVDDQTDLPAKSKQQTFFDAIDNSDIGELDSAKELRDCVEALNIHTVMGERLADIINACISRLEEKRDKLEVWTDSRFLGRSSEVDTAYNKLEDSSIQCVCISGLGGQGKTYLARNVLLQLKTKRPDMIVVQVNLRDSNITDTKDVIRFMLSQSQSCELRGKEDHVELMNILKKYLQAAYQRIVFYLDDCDAVLHSDEDVFLQFIKDFMALLCDRHAPQVKILMTSRVKVSSLLKDERLAEIELQGLETEDAVKMFLAYSEQKEVHECTIKTIIEECAYSPLAISMMASLVKDGKLTPESLTFHLKMDKKNVTAQMKVDKCIQESIKNLQPVYQQSLVGLSVFQSSSFNIADAEKVIKKVLDNSLGDDRNIGSILQSLYDFHLLEAEDYGTVKQKSNQPRRRCRYSLHPLVFRFLSEWKKEKPLIKCYEVAVQQFVSICEKIIYKIVKLKESEHHRGQKKLVENEVHIMKFYDIMSDHANFLPPHPKKTSETGLFQKKCVSDLADTLLSLVKMRRMFQSEADRALKVKNNEVYIFWMVEKADVFLMLHDKPDIAMNILDELSKGKFTALDRQDDRLFYKPLIHALFHKVKGMTYFKLFNHQSAQHHLNMSLRFYEKCLKPMHNMLIVRVQCFQGCVLIDLGQLDDAEQVLRQALSSIKKIVHSSTTQEDEDVAGELHWDIPRFYTFFAKIELKRAMAAGDKFVKDHFLERSLEHLNHGMKLDKLLKLDRLDGFYSKMKLQADVYIEKGMLDEALVDANYVMDQRREILQPPHTKYTESVYLVGKIYMLKGNELLEKEGQEEAHKHWICASDYFNEVMKCHLKEGGMSLLNPVLQEIKRDHIAVINLVGSKSDIQRIVRFYQDLENGAYEPEKKSSSKSILKMLHTPKEMMQKFFGGGGAAFGEDGGRLARLVSQGQEQHERMMRGEPSGGRRRDSGMGNSSFEDDSVSSGSGSMSDNLSRLNLEKSVSLEDNVFERSSEQEVSPTTQRRKQMRKRQKIIDEEK